MKQKIPSILSDPLTGGSLIFLAVAVATGILTGGSQWAEVSGALTVAYAIAASCSRLLPQWSNRMGWIITVAGILMSSGIGMNLRVWTAGDATLSHPYLLFDYARDFYAAAQYAEQGIMPSGTKMGYQLLIGALMRITGVNVVYPAALSMMFTLLGISLGGEVTAMLIHTNEDKRRTASTGALLIALPAIVILHGTVVLKDAGVMLAFTCLAYGLAKLYHGRLGSDGILISATGAIILMILKSQMGFFYIAGILIMGCFRPSYNKIQISDCIFLALLAYAIISGGSYFKQVTINSTFSPTTAGFLAVDGPDRYGQMMGDYYDSSWWLRFALSPFTSAVQTLLPLPWHWARDMRLGGFFWYGHLTYFWYAISACIFGYFIFLWGRKHSGDLTKWAFWWILCYAGTAVYSTGTSARYFLPLIPAGIPLAIQFLHSFRIYRQQRKRYIVFLCIYGFIISTGLLIAGICFSN